MPCGPEFEVGVEMSVIAPVTGSSRPMKLFTWSVYQTMPLGASAGSCGKAPARGIMNSVMAGAVAAGPDGSSDSISVGASLEQAETVSAKAANARLRKSSMEPPWLHKGHATRDGGVRPSTLAHQRFAT